MKKVTYRDFKSKVYGSLIKYKKEELRIAERGVSSRGVAHDCLLPEPYRSSDIPVMIYEGIIDVVKEIQNGEYAYKPHIAASSNVASSQTACINLFVPILESNHADDILKKSGIAPKNFDHIDRNKLRKGYCFEYWDSQTEGKKGLLGDHTPHAGTDSDVAICYINKEGNSCLWLIEHKLTEKEFTTCGAYRSKHNPKELKQNCLNCRLEDFYNDHNKCHYHKNCGYYYWEIMEHTNSQKFFSGTYIKHGCPFRGGMNQLWRNQMMALELERRGLFKDVFFSVVSHPDNIYLDNSINEYKQLTNDNNKFSNFKSCSLVDAALDYLPEWARWYKRAYLGEN